MDGTQSGAKGENIVTRYSQGRKDDAASGSPETEDRERQGNAPIGATAHVRRRNTRYRLKARRIHPIFFHAIVFIGLLISLIYNH